MVLWRWTEEVPFSSLYRGLELLTNHRFRDSVSGSKVSMTLETPSYSHRSGQAVLQKTHMNPPHTHNLGGMKKRE